MSGKLRFRYALQPVLLTRQWNLDSLLVELGEQNAALAAQAMLEADVEALAVAADAEWHARNAGGQMQSVDQFMRASRYKDDLARQARELAARSAELAAERDALIERVVAARRAVDAAEQHRDEMRLRFVQQRLSGDFKVADDQWNTLQSGAAVNGN